MLKSDAMTLGISEIIIRKLVPHVTRAVAGGSLLERNFCDFGGAVDPEWNADSSNATCDVHL